MAIPSLGGAPASPPPLFPPRADLLYVEMCASHSTGFCVLVLGGAAQYTLWISAVSYALYHVIVLAAIGIQPEFICMCFVVLICAGRIFSWMHKWSGFWSAVLVASPRERHPPAFHIPGNGWPGAFKTCDHALGSRQAHAGADVVIVGALFDW